MGCICTEKQAQTSAEQENIHTDGHGDLGTNSEWSLIKSPSLVSQMKLTQWILFRSVTVVASGTVLCYCCIDHTFMVRFGLMWTFLRHAITGHYLGFDLTSLM